MWFSVYGREVVTVTTLERRQSNDNDREARVPFMTHTGMKTLVDCGELLVYNQHLEQPLKRCTEIRSTELHNSERLRKYVQETHIKAGKRHR